MWQLVHDLLYRVEFGHRLDLMSSKVFPSLIGSVILWGTLRCLTGDG